MSGSEPAPVDRIPGPDGALPRQVARSADPFLAGSPSIINNSYLLTLLTDYGFASQIGRPLLMPLSRVGHVCLFASRAFFDSPRGRWVFKCFCHSIVMYIFHMALFEPKGCDRELVGHGMADRQQRVPPGIAAWLFTASNARVSKVWAMQVLLGLLFLTVLSMGIDIVQMCIFQYGASLSRFLAVESVTNRMDVIQFATLAACATLWLLVESGVFGACEDQVKAPARSIAGPPAGAALFRPEPLIDPRLVFPARS